MRRILLLAASLHLAGTMAARAEEYGFYSNSGAAFCDGVRFSNTHPAVGYHVFDETNCVYKPDYLGGFRGPIRDLGPGDWYTFPVSNLISDPDGQQTTYTYYINTRSLLWVLAEESADVSYPFAVVLRGTLVKGKPYARVGAPRLKMSALDAARALEPVGVK